MQNCIFCEIVRGIAPASIVYSDEKVVAFLEAQPVNPGHVLVIPTVHAAGLGDLDEESGCQMLTAAMRIANALKRSGLRCDGVNLLLSDGEAAFQEVFHVHLHIIPRFKGDNFGIKFGCQYGLKPSRAELDRVATKIVACLPTL